MTTSFSIDKIYLYFEEKEKRIQFIDLISHKSLGPYDNYVA